MQHAQLVEHVRQLVKEVLADRGVVVSGELVESILIRDGFYCGRCFSFGEHRAVWFLEENIIKFFSRKSGLLFTRTADSVVPASRGMAA